jgi:hypothetical protein
MRKTTPAEMLVPFVVTMAGCGAMTAVAYYYPDAPIKYIYGILTLTVALLIVVAFLLTRARKKAT